MKHNYLVTTGIFFLSLLLFTWGIYAQEITSFDSRFYLFAKEMWLNGVSWFPATYGQPYPDYPVTSTLLIYFLAKIFGTLNKLIAVLPSALAAAWTVVLTYRIGALRDKNWGLSAVCFMLMTLMFLKCARSISLDMYSTMITTWCFYILSSRTCHPAQLLARDPAPLANTARSSTFLLFLLALSFAFRGPIGLVMPAGVICSYYALNREWKKLFLFGIGATLVLTVCTTILLATAYHVGGDSFLQDVIRMQVVGRIDNTFQPIYFYFTNSLGNYALSYPIAIIVMMTILFSGKFKLLSVIARSRHCEKRSVRRSNPGLNGDEAIQTSNVLSTTFSKNDMTLLLKLLAWTLIIMIGMSIPGDKKARYILPIVPAIALIAAYPFAIKWRKKVSIFALAVVALTLNVIYIRGVEPALLAHDKTAEFVTAVETLRAKNHAELVFYRENADGTPIKYQVYNLQNDNPLFIETEQQLLDYQPNAFFITSEDYFSQLSPKTLSHFSIIARDKVGHVVMVVFTRK